MSRGQGLENVKEFDWVKQPNGRYTIFDVPIFGTFKDDKRGAVEIEDLQHVISSFNENKGENFHYPRIHVGHHEKLENRPGAGYLDNLILKGDTIFADLVEITPDIFEQIIREMKFPYVSAEYNPDKKQITSLALLESQSPYFKYPLLALAQEPQEASTFQDCFSDWQSRSDFIMKFQENFQEGENMPLKDKEDEEDKKEESSKEEFCGDPEGQEKETMTEDKSKNYNCQEQMGGLHEKIDRMLSMSEEIHGWEKEEHEEGSEMDEDDDMEPSEPMQPEDNEMAEPRSVSYQDKTSVGRAIYGLQKGMVQMQKEISKIGRRVVQRDETEKILASKSRLRQICNDRGLNFQAEFDKLQRFSTDQDRTLFMDTLELIQSPKRHPASRMLNKFIEENPKEKVCSKYQGDEKKVAMQAYDSYLETKDAYTDEDWKKFQSVHGGISKFVESAVQNPKGFKFLIGE